ncbi:MAG: hypothetical protein ACLUEU_01265 [Oscillospiraceae bacterium]
MKTLTADQLSAFFQEARDSGVYEALLPRPRHRTYGGANCWD